MREKTRDAVRKALFEAFFVVLAVALALAANEWRQDLADQRQASSALASIVEELESNRAAVQSSLDYHTDRLLEQFEKTLAVLGHAATGE